MFPFAAEVPALCAFLYKHGDVQTSTRTVIYHVYHLALHNNYQKAHDLMLMCQVQDTVHDMDISTRILFNRTMVRHSSSIAVIAHC